MTTGETCPQKRRLWRKYCRLFLLRIIPLNYQQKVQNIVLCLFLVIPKQIWQSYFYRQNKKNGAFTLCRFFIFFIINLVIFFSYSFASHFKIFIVYFYADKFSICINASYSRASASHKRV